MSCYRKKYYSEDAWKQMLARTAPEAVERHSIEWFDLYLEAGTLLKEDPSSKRAKDFARRWMELAERTTGGDPAIRDGGIRAWTDRQNWPPAIRQLAAAFNLEKIAHFVAQANTAWNKKYYDDEAWAKLTGLQTESPAHARWAALREEVKAALGEDPSSEKAQDLALRWMELVEETTAGDPKIKAGTTKAWRHRKRWPAWKQRELKESNLEAISNFIGKAVDWPFEKYFSEAAWYKRISLRHQKTPAQTDDALQTRAQLFRDVEAALDQPPAGEIAELLATRWLELRNREGFSDPDILAGLTRAWADLPNWPKALRLREAASYEMKLDVWEKAAAFIDQAIANRHR